MADTDVDLTKQVKNVLAVPNGGMGSASHTLGALIVGNNVAAVGEILPGSNGDVLQVIAGAWATAPATGGTTQRTFSFFMG